MRGINSLKPAEGSRKNKKRIGRGPGSGWGCTAGYGYNGSKARSGDRLKLYFEGGQTPLTRRLPKRGFTNIFKVFFQIINLGQLQNMDIAEKEIDRAWFYKKGLIHSIDMPVKVLGSGAFSKAITIKAEAFSRTAREKLEKSKGKAVEQAVP